MTRFAKNALLTLLLLLGVIPPAFAQAQADPYRYLEEREGPEALKWAEVHNTPTLERIKGDPSYEETYQAALAILTDKGRLVYPELTAAGNIRNFWQDQEHPRGVWREATLASYLSNNTVWKKLLDVDALSKEEGVNWVLQGISCLEPQGAPCLIDLSDRGKDAVTTREFNPETGEFLPQGFVVPENKGSYSWVDKDTVLISTDWGEGSLTPAGYPFIVKKWSRGTPLSAATTVFTGSQQDTSVSAVVFTNYKGSLPFVVRRKADSNEVELYSVLSGGGPQLIPLPLKRVVYDILGDEEMIFSPRENWAYQGTSYPMGSVLSFNLKTEKVGLIYSPSNDRTAVQTVAVTKSQLFIEITENVIGKLLRFTRRDGQWESREIPMPGKGVVTLSSYTSFGEGITFLYENPLTPKTIFYISPEGEVEKWKESPAFFDASDMVVLQREAISKDGTKIPYFLVGLKSVLEKGNAPTLLYAYGGFKHTVLPKYSGVEGELLLKKGFAYAIANVRGGLEFGPAWHQAGLRQNRQRIFEDFFAVSEDLINTGVTTPSQLGIQGGSNGGLLMGVAFTQRPELYAAVLCEMPLLDMERYTAMPPGKSWIGEYGDPADLTVLEYLLKYSPYHNIPRGKKLPHIFFRTSRFDDRVNPGHARKMAARLIELGYGPLVDFYENAEGGHSAGATPEQRAEDMAMSYVYLYQHLLKR